VGSYLGVWLGRRCSSEWWVNGEPFTETVEFKWSDSKESTKQIEGRDEPPAQSVSSIIQLSPRPYTPQLGWISWLGSYLCTPQFGWIVYLPNDNPVQPHQLLVVDDAHTRVPSQETEDQRWCGAGSEDPSDWYLISTWLHWSHPRKVRVQCKGLTKCLEQDEHKGHFREHPKPNLDWCTEPNVDNYMEEFLGEPTCSNWWGMVKNSESSTEQCCSIVVGFALHARGWFRMTHGNAHPQHRSSGFITAYQIPKCTGDIPQHSEDALQ